MNASSRILPEKLGKYEVRREVGRGGMGIVYEGFDPLIDRRVALKTFINEFFDGTQSDNLLTRLRREAQAAGRLSHPNIIAVYEYGEDVVPTRTAARPRPHSSRWSSSRAARSRAISKPTSASRCAKSNASCPSCSTRSNIRMRTASYIATSKPANIILLKDGSVKVADFGVARIESSTLTQVGTVLGSPSYMSPEQFMGQTVDGRSDLYSAGVVLYQLLTAEVPFTGAFTTIMHKVLNDSPPPPSALNFQVPKGYDAILRRAMAKRPDERYQTAAEFKQAIQSASSGAAQAGAAQAGAAAAGNQTMMRPGAAGPGAVRAASSPPRPRALSPALLFTLLALALAGTAAAYFMLGPRFGLPLTAKLEPAAGPPARPAAGAPNGSDAGTTGGGTADGQGGGGDGGSAIISAVGLADPSDPRYSNDAAGLERTVWRDARREVVAKAAALYVDPDSINANYPIVRDKLLAHSDEFIKTVLDQSPPQMSQYGLMVGTMRASVDVREVQKTLNQISHDDRIDFIRNNGDPRISVTVRAAQPGDDGGAPAPRSPAAENLLKERIHSFGFTVVDDASAKPPADFHVDGEVRFKRLSAKLAASGLTIEKFVITSWTVKAINTRTGEEIYHNTAIPEKQSWASQELALQDVGSADRRGVHQDVLPAVLRLQTEEGPAALLRSAGHGRDPGARRNQLESGRAQCRAGAAAGQRSRRRHAALGGQRLRGESRRAGPAGPPQSQARDHLLHAARGRRCSRDPYRIFEHLHDRCDAQAAAKCATGITDGSAAIAYSGCRQGSEFVASGADLIEPASAT